MQKDVLDHLRSICLAYPEAVETGGVGDPSFKVRDKIFAMQHQMDGRMSLWCKARPGAQQVLVGSEPERYFVPPYVGHHGWVGIWLDIDVDWDIVADLVDESYRITAPKRLLAQLDHC
ncbi:MAG TPA: MmcQ/YjbR family DNA-binding protein [Ktedonobacteraceae bacterium]|jgi:predicted DNA-binding protein (MmcQ/YjbR family)|nr:MmcQ/YjbR family DNA-binding protein [Ktedonobacteraceae bacterium]